LGRLIEEGLIDQMDNGRYKIMMKGLETIKDLESVQNIFQKQFELLLRLGNTGGAPALASNFDKMTDEQERNRYKHFLRTELRKVNQQG